MNNKDFLFVVIFYYVGWFGSIKFAQSFFDLFPLVFPVILISYLKVRKLLSLEETMIASGMTALGLLFDFAAWKLGLVSIEGFALILVPTWLVSIWFLFAFSMVKLVAHIRFPIFVCGLLGFIFGPLSYKSGELFKILYFKSTTAIAVYAVFWAFFFSMIIFFYRRTQWKFQK